MEFDIFVVMAYIRSQRHKKEDKYQKKRNYFESMRFHGLIISCFSNMLKELSISFYQTNIRNR